MIHIKTHKQLFESDIHTSIAYNNTDYFFKLIKKPNIDINEINDSLNTPLIIAAINGVSEIVKILIEKGAKLDIQNREGYTALIAAAQEFHKVRKVNRKKDYYDIIKMLIEAGADWNINHLSYRKEGFLLYFNEYEKEELLDMYPEEYKKYLRKLKSKKFNL